MGPTRLELQSQVPPDPCPCCASHEEHSGFGEMLKDDTEKSHQDMDHIHWRPSGLVSCAKHSVAISRTKTRSNPSVQAIAMKVKEGSKRRRQGPSKAEEKKKVMKVT